MKPHKLVQISVFLKKAKFTLLKFIYIPFKTATKQLLAYSGNKLRED